MKRKIIMKLLLVLATAITLASAGSRYRNEHRHSERERERERERDRRANLDYDDIETADQDQVERFDEPKVSNRIGVYSTVHTFQAKNKAQRRHSKHAVKDSEAQGTHYEGAHYGAHYAGLQQIQPQVQQIHTHELLTSQGLVPIYQNQLTAGPGGGNIVLTSGLGVTGLGEGHNLHAHHAPLIVTGGGGGGPQLIHANPAGVGPVPGPENDLGADITKSVYVFSPPPDPFDYALPRQTLSKLPPRPQKHYQVLFINAPSPPPPQQHHVELPPPPELKTLVYVLVKKPQAPPPINFIKSPHPHPLNKPEVYFIRYKNRGFGGPIDEPGVLPVAHHHPGPVQYQLGPQEELRGNIDYGPALQPQYETAHHHHPYQLEEYQDDSHIAASHPLSQRSQGREVDAGVSGI